MSCFSYIAKSRSLSANMLRSPCEDVAGVNVFTSWNLSIDLIFVVMRGLHVF